MSRHRKLYVHWTGRRFSRTSDREFMCVTGDRENRSTPIDSSCRQITIRLSGNDTPPSRLIWNSTWGGLAWQSADARLRQVPQQERRLRINLTDSQAITMETSPNNIFRVSVIGECWLEVN